METPDTRYLGKSEEVHALNSFLKLMRAAESLTARLTPRLAAAGLTMSQFCALEVLLHVGPLCQSELGRKLLRSGGNVTLVIDNLERRGLVRRERGEDRRFMTVHLTAEGRRLIHKVFPKYVEALVQEMSLLSGAEQKQLGELCKKVERGSAVETAACRPGRRKR